MKKSSKSRRPGRWAQNGRDTHLPLIPPTNDPVGCSVRAAGTSPSTIPVGGGSSPEKRRLADLLPADLPPTGDHLLPLAVTVKTLLDTAALKDQFKETVIAMQELLKERDVAGILKISVKTLQLWRYEGKGPPYVKIGRCVRYRTSALAAFIDAHEVPHKPFQKQPAVEAVR